MAEPETRNFYSLDSAARRLGCNGDWLAKVAKEARIDLLMIRAGKGTGRGIGKLFLTQSQFEALEPIVKRRRTTTKEEA